MKATQNQLQDLLELNALDRQIAKTRIEAESLGKDPRYVKLQEELKASSTDFIAANNRIDGLRLEMQRLKVDVELVEKRIAKDRASLRTTSVVKEAQGLQHELKTLERRQGELEDQEFAILEQQEQAEAGLRGVAEARSSIESQLKAVIDELNREKAKLVSGLSLSDADRRQLVERLPGELVDHYEAKRKRGIPIGRLIHSECGACRMSVSATNLAMILKAPIDEMVYCPDCNAILVR